MKTLSVLLLALCGAAFAAEDFTKGTNFCTDKDNENRKSLSIDVSDIKALKLNAQKEHEAIAKRFKEELKRFEKAKPVPKEEKPKKKEAIPENSVRKNTAPEGRLVRVEYVYPKGYNKKT